MDNKIMTVKEILWKDLPHNCTMENESVILSKMKEYALLKCQELLEIVVQEAKIIEIRSIINGYDYTERWIDKDSILSAVDLDSFIS